MRVLVAVASRHGSTTEIAAEIGAVVEETLWAAGTLGEVDVRHAASVRRVAGYQAVVLGSAVYQGQWLEPMHRLIEGNVADLRDRPVWLFSSGPVGDPPKPAEDPRDVPAIAESVGAYGHRVFGGRLRRRDLGVLERMVVRAMSVRDGDYRDWPSIRAWAVGIGAILARRENVPLGRVPQHRA
jgi:menaquinone-dependent protoporphyrinogen oxidase